MESFTQLIIQWEIQLLVLLSFTLQLFLFLTGNLRQYSNSILLRVSIWSAYLGADLVAIYALGFLSRHEDSLGGTHQLAFFWAPFLLIHLGGQDTITAFSIEDNNLWLRHLLNLVVQVALALYVFWWSIGKHNMHLLAPGIFLFVSGIIKYVERTMALMYGGLENMRNSIRDSEEFEVRPYPDYSGYSGIVRCALLSALYVRHVFAGSTIFQTGPISKRMHFNACEGRYSKLEMRKLLEVELGIMYGDLYTKAMVLRTRSGTIFRCISQVSTVIALVLFFLASSSNKQQGRYSRADVAITYVLFVGGIFLDICAVFILMTSPWTWERLKGYNNVLGRVSWYFLSSNIGWTESRPLWSNSMGQYSLLGWLEGSSNSSDQPRLSCSCKQLIKMMAEKMMGLVCSTSSKKEKLFWLSTLLDTKYTQVDSEVMDSVVQFICDLCREIRQHTAARRGTVLWPCLGELLLNCLKVEIKVEFARAIVRLHVFTELHLTRRSSSYGREISEEAMKLAEVCRKLSNYMMYLLAVHPEMLPVTGKVDDVILTSDMFISGLGLGEGRDDEYGIQPCYDTLKNIRDMWILFLAYAAGKSRPETQAAHLGRGGELITFVWLLMAHYGLGDSGFRSIEFSADEQTTKETEGYMVIPLMRDSEYSEDWEKLRQRQQKNDLREENTVQIPRRSELSPADRCTMHMLSPVSSLESIEMATQSSLKGGFHKHLSQHQSVSQSPPTTNHTELSSEMAMLTTGTAPLSLKLLVDTNSQRVLFAEASKEAVDFLFSILTLPVGTGADNEGFVTYTVMDDLKVTPMSAIASVTLLTSCGVKDLSVLQEKTVQLGYNEGLEILKASLQSKTVLTHVFLANKHPCNA